MTRFSLSARGAVFGAAALMLSFTAATASAQRTSLTGVQSTIVTSDTRVGAGVGINNSFYLPPRTSAIHSGIANLNIDFGVLGTGGCTGSLMASGRHVLTAAHCVSNENGVVIANGGLARFRDPGTGANNDYTVSSIAVRDGYSGFVVDGRDVAILTLDRDVDAFVRRYSIASQYGLDEVVRFAGFGRTGTGITGDDDGISNGQFGNDYVLREGFNQFQQFCSAAPANQIPGVAECSTGNGTGSIWLSDFDDPDTQFPTLMCDFYGECSPGLGNPNEVGIGRGDSGGAAFNSAFEVLGVASWGTNGFAGFGSFDAINGHACVANIQGSAECQANYNWIQSQIAPNVVVPEPSTYALMGFGLLAMAGIARRRRATS